MSHRIPPKSGTAFILRKGERLTVTDPEGEQVSDMVAYNLDDRKEMISSGRSLDYAGRMFLTKGDMLYSNRSRDMLKIVEDEVGRHDFTLTPCSKDTFRKLYNEADPQGGCQENLEAALAEYGIGPDRVQHLHACRDRSSDGRDQGFATSEQSGAVDYVRSLHGPSDRHDQLLRRRVQ